MLKKKTKEYSEVLHHHQWILVFPRGKMRWESGKLEITSYNLSNQNRAHFCAKQIHSSSIAVVGNENET